MKNKKSGFIYIAKFRNNFSGTIKIGMTGKTDPKDRERSLNSTSLPEHMDMIKVWAVADAKEIESRIHRDPGLKKFRTDGKEWFTVPVDDAIAICDKYCVQFNNARFRSLWLDFSRAKKQDQVLFYTLLFRRSLAVDCYLTEWEKENPGQQSANRRQTAVGLQPNRFRDIIAFWQEWQGLSQTFGEFIQERPCDGLGYRGYLEHQPEHTHPNDRYYDDQQPSTPFWADSRYNMEGQLEKFRKELKCYFTGYTKSIDWYISQDLLKGKPKKQDLYAVRMEPHAKLMAFMDSIDPHNVDLMIEKNYITPTRAILETKVAEAEKETQKRARKEAAQRWKEYRQRQQAEKHQQRQEARERREVDNWEDRMNRGGILLTAGILLSVFYLAYIGSLG